MVLFAASIYLFIQSHFSSLCLCQLLQSTGAWVCNSSLKSHFFLWKDLIATFLVKYTFYFRVKNIFNFHIRVGNSMVILLAVFEVVLLLPLDDYKIFCSILCIYFLRVYCTTWIYGFLYFHYVGKFFSFLFWLSISLLFFYSNRLPVLFMWDILLYLKFFVFANFLRFF